jgi:hypothetical protein
VTRPEPERDRYGRYLLPDLETGRKRSWTRTTTLAKAISETGALEKWKLRTALKGIANAKHLLDVVEFTDDRTELDAVAEKALQAGGAGVRAELGTELHSLTEQVDEGSLRLSDVPAEHREDVRAYVFALAEAGIEVVPAYIERIVVNTIVDVAGTFDRIVRIPDGRLVIADLKTGSDLSYGWDEIEAQLAIYATAAGMYDPEAEVYEALPPVDQHEGLVFHLPVGSGRCTIHPADLENGWRYARVAYVARAARGRRRLPNPIDPTALRAAGALMDAIGTAGTRAELEALWSAQHTAWTPRHIEAARTRAAELPKEITHV